MNSIGDLLSKEMQRLDAFAKRTTGKSVAEITREFQHRRDTLYAQPDKLQRMMRDQMTQKSRDDWESRYGVHEGDFIRIVMPGEQPNRWALSPWQFGPILHAQGYSIPDATHDTKTKEFWTSDVVAEFRAMMDRNREIELSRFGRPA